MGLKVAFFCGHQSPYGLAHLIPVINEFDVRVVIIGVNKRWDIFRQKLSGNTYYESRNDFYYNLAKTLAKKILPTSIIKLFRPDFQKAIDIDRLLHKKGIECWEVFDVNSSEFIEKIKKMDVDLFVSAAYPQIYSKTTLDIPRKGAVNFHPALLPKYRGAHPHYWQIVNGEKEGGLTAHFMTENIDNGDIIAQLSFPIEDITYSQLYKKIVENTPALVNEVKVFFKKQTIQAKPQNSENSTSYHNEREIHSKIFWNIQSSQEIYNLIRTEKAFCFFRGKKVIFASSYTTKSNRNLTNGIRVENGTIIDIGKDSISVKTFNGCINIKEMKKGRKNISFYQWANSEKIHIGEKFD